MPRHSAFRIIPEIGPHDDQAFCRIDMGEKVIINIRAHQDGHRPPDRVLPNRV